MKSRGGTCKCQRVMEVEHAYSLVCDIASHHGLLLNRTCFPSENAEELPLWIGQVQASKRKLSDRFPLSGRRSKIHHRLSQSQTLVRPCVGLPEEKKTSSAGSGR